MSAKKRKPGRPRFPDGSAKGSIFAVRLNAGEKAKLEVGAQLAGKSPSAWARHVLLYTAEGLIRREWRRAREYAERVAREKAAAASTGHSEDTPPVPAKPR